jgi:acetylornithine deacetylase
VSVVIQHLTNLIRIPSPSYLSNRSIIDYAINALREAQWHYREMVYHDAAAVEKVNLIAAPRHQDLDDATVDLALMCHTDTVPYPTDWAQALDPFVADGQLYGCGACDVKGFLACLLTSISEIAPSNLINGLRLILTADEEVGCVGAAHLVASGSIQPRRVIIGEPTS